MLYIVPTPIGNLEDITLRALRILREVDVIAAEDTRKTLNLLNHFEIKKPLISYYEHNKRLHGDLLLEHLRRGESVALVSDAGSPGICDPGTDLIKQALAEGLELCVLPGACAAITALVASGLSTESFAFCGFLPREKSERRKLLHNLSEEVRTLCFYEAPHRINACLQDTYAAFGDRRIAICRELTKKFEEIQRGSLSELCLLYEQKEPKGEFVLIIEGASPKQAEPPSEEQLLSEFVQLIEQGLSRKSASKQLAEKYGIPSKELYALSLK